MENERPTPLIEDIDGTRRKLEAWISEHRGHTVSIPELSIPEATGMSNVTLVFDTTWEENHQARSEAVVARLQPEIERPVFPDNAITSPVSTESPGTTNVQELCAYNAVMPSWCSTLTNRPYAPSSAASSTIPAPAERT